MTISFPRFKQETETARIHCDICEEARTGDQIRCPYKPEENDGLGYNERMKDVRNILVKTLIKEGWSITARKDKDELILCPQCMKHTILEYIRNNFKG